MWTIVLRCWGSPKYYNDNSSDQGGQIYAEGIGYLGNVCDSFRNCWCWGLLQAEERPQEQETAGR